MSNLVLIVKGVINKPFKIYSIIFLCFLIFYSLFQKVLYNSLKKVDVIAQVLNEDINRIILKNALFGGGVLLLLFISTNISKDYSQGFFYKKISTTNSRDSLFYEIITRNLIYSLVFTLIAVLTFTIYSIVDKAYFDLSNTILLFVNYMYVTQIFTIISLYLRSSAFSIILSLVLYSFSFILASVYHILEINSIISLLPFTISYLMKDILTLWQNPFVLISSCAYYIVTFILLNLKISKSSFA